ncbi:type II secretion system protein GspK [Anaerohalosphaera lusitana]|nr:type II secretion system protein GspK [Anaerohalosphaera lusitana]
MHSNANTTNNCRRGSALLLVVVVTVLLAAIGVIFLMMSRLEEMATSSIAENEQLDAGAQAVTAHIGEVLVDDLFDPDGTWNDEPTAQQPWLASVEPGLDSDNGTPFDPGDDEFLWDQVSRLYEVFPGYANFNDVVADVVSDNEPISFDSLLADADGDGVSDSIWMIVPGITGTRGENIYAAVRIVDNCAMLNLNTALECPGDSEGRYLSAVDYNGFLRGSDAALLDSGGGWNEETNDPNNLKRARWVDYDTNFDSLNPAFWHDNVILNIEQPGPAFNLFDIAEELEIRNRFLLTSKVESRFERKDVLNYTLDSGGGIYSTLTIPIEEGNFEARNPGTGATEYFDNFGRWSWRMDSRNFSDPLPDGSDPANPAPYRYDRRHVCTFYSFDRELGKQAYPYVNGELGLLDRDRADEFLTPAGVVEWYIDNIDADYDGPAAADIFMPYRGPVNLRELKMLPPDATEEEKLEVRKTVLQSLYAFRAYYIEKYPDEDPHDAAVRAGQAVANLIDNMDGTNTDGLIGPFADADYGSQQSEDITYIDRDIVQQLILDVSLDALNFDDTTNYQIDITDGSGTLLEIEFGLGTDVADEVVFGYEKQPFISEFYMASSDVGGTFEITSVGLGLLNPYDKSFSLDEWGVRVGSTGEVRKLTPTYAGTVVGPYNDSNAEPFGRQKIMNTMLDGDIISEIKSAYDPNSPDGGDVAVYLMRLDPTTSELSSDLQEYVAVDMVPSADVSELVGRIDQAAQNSSAGQFSCERDESGWKFADAGSCEYVDVAGDWVLTQPNTAALPDAHSYQLPVADDGEAIETLLDLEKVATGLRVHVDGDPNTLTSRIADSAESNIRFDIEAAAAGDVSLLDYVCLLNRPEGDLPGRINVNTATKEVIRAAIPDNGDWDRDALAAAIVESRDTTGPFASLGDLLEVPGFKALAEDSEDLAGTDPLMKDDFEERDYILSRVANVFTVRSDVFTAYITVRLGENGPQKRMIAIYDRSNVYSPDDEPELVALHPVPNPR